MQQKHKYFIQTMQKLSNDSNRELLECVTKSYIINEGIADYAKRIYGKMRDFVHSKPAVNGNSTNTMSNGTPEPKKDTANVQTAAKAPAQSSYLSHTDREILRNDKQTFSADFQKFLQACKGVMDYMVKFGDGEFMKEILSNDFEKMYRRGLYIDKLRPSPLSEALERSMQFAAVLESLRTVSNSPLIDSIYEVFSITESEYGINAMPLVEAMEDTHEIINNVPPSPAEKEKADGMLHKCVAEIKDFIGKHGAWPWRKATRTKKFNRAKEIGAAIRKQQASGTVA